MVFTACVAILNAFWVVPFTASGFESQAQVTSALSLSGRADAVRVVNALAPLMNAPDALGLRNSRGLMAAFGHPQLAVDDWSARLAPIGFIPARLTGYGERWEGDECVLYAEGVVRQAAVFGEAIELRRRIEARMGESRFTIHDEVTNVGFDPTTHMYLYRVNVGWPVVDEASAYLIPAPDGVPVAAYPTHDYRRLTPPNPAFAEECYEHSVVPERGGTVPVGIVNRRLGLGLYQVYRSDQFPFHTMWRMLGEGIYGVAMEPTTNRDAGRFDARERGELGYIAPQESRGYDLEIGALDGADAIEAFAQRVEAVTEPQTKQGSRSRA